MPATMTVAALLAVLALGACTENTYRTTLRGSLIGASIGLIAGAGYGHPFEGAARGAVLGAATGAIVGTLDEIGGHSHRHDRRRYEYRRGYGY